MCSALTCNKSLLKIFIKKIELFNLIVIIDSIILNVIETRFIPPFIHFQSNQLCFEMQKKYIFHFYMNFNKKYSLQNDFFFIYWDIMLFTPVETSKPKLSFLY